MYYLPLDLCDYLDFTVETQQAYSYVFHFW